MRAFWEGFLAGLTISVALIAAFAVGYTIFSVVNMLMGGLAAWLASAAMAFSVLCGFLALADADEAEEEHSPADDQWYV